MKFEDLIKSLGEFGPYQRRIYFLLCLPAITYALHKFVWVFVGAVPNHRCVLFIDELFNHSLPYDLPKEILNISIPYDEKDKKWDSCRRFVVDTDDIHLDGISSKTNLSSLEYDLIGMTRNQTEQCSAWVYDTSIYKDSVVTDFNLVCGRKWQHAVLQSFFMGGEFVGAVASGTISDRFGRRRIFFIAVILQAVFGILCGVASNYFLYLIFRALVGLLAPGVFLVGFVIGLELVGPSKRLIAGSGSQFFFATGYLLAALVAYYIREWQILQIVISVPGLCFLVYWWFIPESARWLLAKQRIEEAKVILQKVAAENGTKLPESFYEPSLQESSKQENNPLLLFRYPNMRKKTLIICFNWFSNSFVYYGLSFNTSNLGGNPYVNYVIAALIEYPAYVFNIIALDRFGRRFPLCGWMIIGGTALLITCLLPDDSTIVLITLAMIGKFGITISYAIIYIFSAELYPTVTRNIGMGMSSTCARLGGILAPFVLLLGDTSRVIPLIIFGGISLLAGLLALILPETEGQDLPDSLEEGDLFGRPVDKKIEMSQL